MLLKSACKLLGFGTQLTVSQVLKGESEKIDTCMYFYAMKT